MRVLSGSGDPDAFFRRLRAAPARVLLLDYDGTLAPFHVQRDQASPYPGAREAVRRIMDQGRTRVVVVSGRSLEDLRERLGLEPAPELWGTHGWERLHAGGHVEGRDPGKAALAALQAGRRLAEREVPAERVEVKPASVAVHVRGLAERDARRILEATRAAWGSLCGEGTVEIREFDGGVELRVPGEHKGTAVTRILSEAPVGAAVAYLGDDLTDEDAFAALEGRGLAVLVRDALRETSADVWIKPPEELLGFLERWHENT